MYMFLSKTLSHNSVGAAGESDSFSDHHVEGSDDRNSFKEKFKTVVSSFDHFDQFWIKKSFLSEIEGVIFKEHKFLLKIKDVT